MPAKFPSLISLLLSLALPGLALADGGAGETVQLANVEASATRIVFEPLVEFQELTLTVRGPYEFLSEQTFTKGSPTFELGGSEVDGCYNFELALVPVIDPDYLEALDRARETGDMSEVIALQMAGKLPSGQTTQTGTFNIERGSIVLGGATEEKVLELPPAKSDVTELDQPGLEITPKQTIAESLCVGFDCPANPSFSFTTLLLMENNLRIKFDDTSVAASFPRRDWSLNANDSANGGASRFWIQDCGESSQGGCSGNAVFSVAAGARNNALFIDSQGDLGLGTSTPAVEIHAVSGDTPTLRLEQNGSSGFAPQTWDVAGNETSFFIRDATNGSTLPFRIRPGASSQSLVIDTDDDIGIGVLSPAVDLHVDRGTSQPANLRLSGNSAGFDLDDRNGAVDEKVVQQFVDAGLFRIRGLNDTFTGETVTGITLDLGNGRVGIGNSSGSLAHPLVVGTNGTNGNGAHVTAGGAWTNGSSRAFKEAIAALSASDAMAALAALEPVRFRYTLEPGEEYVGFIAEDVPELVATQDRQHLSPMDIVAVLTKVVQEQQKLFARQQGIIDQQQEALEALTARLAELEP